MENINQNQFIPLIWEGKTCSDDEKQILSLQLKLCRIAFWLNKYNIDIGH